ncbi:FUSC family protein [Streptomyces sp. NBC_01092]|uniref:FUSC family protein n=1 Tax=Streptomyces sp. NBC_01092 TaxID=2903748 RepID=UPI0038630DAB|nr:FUSC family protein [Streptomyces sp. NBC_01092]
MRGGPEWNRILHRSVRVTLAASVGFYTFVYGLDEPVLALYALFAPISLGLLSPIPGSGRQRAEVMLKALPVGLGLVTLGTVLAVHTWAAVLGMFVVGFLLAFAAIAGPRPAGAAPGLQLFYILACFPPYEPETLGLRLAGLIFGVVALVLGELFVLPHPPDPSYRVTLAQALATARDTIAGSNGLSPKELREAGARLRLSGIAPAQRPAGPGRAARGQAQAGSAARRLLEQLAHLTEIGELRDLVRGRAGSGPRGTDSALGSLLPRVVSLLDATVTALHTGRTAPGPQRTDDAIDEFQRMRTRQAAGPVDEVPPADVLRRQAALLAVAESVRALEISVRVGLDGRRTAPIEPRELFWYTHAATPQLWLRRITGNMTLRSVQFHNALRIAIALAAARLVAGSLDLTHGFWVLLAVLTLSRTSVIETWSAIRQVVIGNLVGAVAAGALLIGLGRHTEAYAAILAPAMLIAFALGPLLGIAWAQGLFTLVVATAFAQIAPASWRLAEARIVDVVTGSAIGLLCGMLAWPAGARAEVRRTMAGLLRECGPLIRGTVAMLGAVPPGSVPAPPTLPALHRLRLAESAYAQFRSEPGSDAHVRADWHAVLITSHHILLGAQWLPRFDLPATALPPGAADRAQARARALAQTTDRLADLCGGRRPRTSGTAPPPGEPAGPPMPALVDLDMWLRSLTAQLTRIEAELPEAIRRPPRGTPVAETGSSRPGPAGPDARGTP